MALISKYSIKAYKEIKNNFGFYVKTTVISFLAILLAIGFVLIFPIVFSFAELRDWAVLALFLIVLFGALFWVLYVSLVMFLSALKKIDILKAFGEAKSYLVPYIIGILKFYGFLILLHVISMIIVFPLIIIWFFLDTSPDVLLYVVAIFIGVPYVLLSIYLTYTMIVQVIKYKKFQLFRTLSYFKDFLKEFIVTIVVLVVLYAVFSPIPILGFMVIILLSIWFLLSIEYWIEDIKI